VSQQELFHLLMYEKFGLKNWQRRKQQVFILPSAACSRTISAPELMIISNEGGESHSHIPSVRKYKCFPWKKIMTN